MAQSNTMLERIIYDQAGFYVDSCYRPNEVFRRLYRNVTTPALGPSMVVDGSLTPQVYEVRPQRPVRIQEMNGYMITDVTLPQPDYWGNVALTNGFQLEVIDADGNVALDFLEGGRILNTTSVGLFAAPALNQEETKKIAGISVVAHLLGIGSSLRLEAGEAMRWTINDDLTDLVEFAIVIIGFYCN